MSGESAPAPQWQPWKLYGVKLQKQSGLEVEEKSVVSVGSQVPIMMAFDGR